MSDSPTVKAQRDAFARDQADAIFASLRTPAIRRKEASGWTSRAVWYESDDSLIAVVGPQEAAKTDLALAHGLYLAKGRKLILALPEAWAFPTLQRAPWFETAIDVHTFASGSTTCTPVVPASKEKTSKLAGGPETTPDKHLGPSGEYVRALVEWATTHPDLDESHRRDLRAWSCRGQRVLVLRGSKSKVSVSAGIDAKSAPAETVSLTSAIDEDTLGRIQARVEQSVGQARSQEFGKYEEHHLQAILRRVPSALGLESPVLREVAAWRPSGGPKNLGRGFIDLVAVDGLGDINLVETKLAADDMLILQGLDYWIWANQPGNDAWLRQRLHADGSQAKLRLVYAVGGKAGSKPVLSRYAKVHLDVLSKDVSWRLALLEDWPSGEPKVDLLPFGTRP